MAMLNNQRVYIYLGSITQLYLRRKILNTLTFSDIGEGLSMASWGVVMKTPLEMTPGILIQY